MNRVVLITGASRGLGAELVGFLAKQGYDLVLTARGDQALQETARSLKEYGGRVNALPGDVADPEHRRKLVGAAQALGGLDLLVNNASELGLSPLPPLAECPLDAFANVFGVNVFAPLGLAPAAMPLLRRRSGLIVNISSDAALGAYPGWGAYGASKAALDLVSRTLANELEGDSVVVVSVDPGDMRTRMHQDAFPGEDISDRPTPDATVRFWGWLLGQARAAVTGRRFQAQSDQWELAA